MLKQFGRHIPRPIVPKSYAILYPNICVPFRKTSDTNLILSEVKNFIKDVLLAKVIYSAKSDSSDKPVSVQNILSIVMLVLILGLLAFVVLHSMRTRQAVQQEEEVSVENILQSTPESELEDIDVESKSETRKMIEKFVDENPESAAALLRNWLNEDWN